MNVVLLCIVILTGFLGIASAVLALIGTEKHLRLHTIVQRVAESLCVITFIMGVFLLLSLLI